MLSPELIQKQIHPILKDLAQTLDVTSVWLCHFDFAQNQTTIVGEYFNLDANAMEALTDIGATYPEYSSQWVQWLRIGDGSKVTHVDEMDRNDPDWLEFVEKGIDTAAYFPVKIMGIVWGFVEVWDSRDKRTFDTIEDAANMHNFSVKIGAQLDRIFSEQAA